MHNGMSAYVTNLEKKQYKNARAIMIFMNININAKFNLIVLLRYLNPFTRFFSSNLFHKQYLIKNHTI